MENGTGNVQDAAARRSYGRILLDAIAEAILNIIVFFFRFTGWSVRWTLATAFFLAVMAAAGLYVFNQAVVGGEYVTVPSIVNLPITEASYRLAEKGLEVGRQTEMPSDQVPEYHVVAQRPEAGRVVRAGRKVFPVVSRGTDFLKAPSLLGKTLEEVDTVFAQGFRRGTTAEIPHSTPRGVVLAQDPAPGRPIGRGGEIHLLTSAGPSGQAYTMPDLVGMPLDEATRLLTPLQVNAIANRVNNPNVAFDTILAQRPEPGAMLHPGETVFYDVRPSDQVQLTRSNRKVEVVYTVPGTWLEREIRIDIVDSHEARRTVFPQQSDYDAGIRPRFKPGSVIRQGFAFPDELTVEVFVDGEKARTYYYEGDEEPVITDHAGSQEGEDSV